MQASTIRRSTAYISLALAILFSPLAGPAPGASATTTGTAVAPVPGRTTTPKELRAAVQAVHQAGAPSVRLFIVGPGGSESYTVGKRRLGGPAPARINDENRVGSVTKMFTATVIMQLVEQGRLSLDQSIDSVLPGLVPNGSNITIAELLGMRSGLASYSDDPAFAQQLYAHPQRKYTPDQLLKVATSLQPTFEPGTNFEYSNTNYVLLGKVIERVTGQPYASVVKKRIFDPTGMKHTMIPSGNAIPNPHIDGYMGTGTSLRNVTDWSPSFGWSAGEAISRPPDVAAFLQALLGGHILSLATVDAMTSNPSLEGETKASSLHYGLGLQITTTSCGTVYGHSGDIPGYYTNAFATRDGGRVAVLSLGIDPVPKALVPSVQAAVEAAICHIAGNA